LALSGDQGADLMFVKRWRRNSCSSEKNISGSVSNKAVQEVVASKAFIIATRHM
jgi:HJR/Mrr/RecB family endonuclease